MSNSKIIYKVVNKETNQIYIGATSDSLLNRKRDHLQKAHKNIGSKFQKAIATYGPEAFEWAQIDSAYSIDELAQKEKQYIAENKSKEVGYNGDIGGGFKKTIYQYEIEDGSLINTFESLNVAANEIGAIKQQLSRACLSVNQTFEGYIWSYEFPFNTNIDKRFKAVEQEGNDGDVVAKYKSIVEASKITGVNKSSIAKVCRGERNQAGGFYWRIIVEF